MTQQRNSAGDQTITGQRAVIFLHIPKTAGTTLLEILDRQYPPETVYSFGADAHESTARFKALDDPKKMSIRLLRGHMAYGRIGAKKPQSTTKEPARRDWTARRRGRTPATCPRIRRPSPR